MMQLTRRSALLGLVSAASLGGSSLSLANAPTPKRFVVVILRGAMDGMMAVTPYGDADLRRHRAPLILPEPGKPSGLVDLGGFFGLHPALARIGALYAGGQALIVHAVAGPARSRSHFESQDVLEMGSSERISSGWLNRALAFIPPVPESETAIALSAAPPMLLRGREPVGTWVQPENAAPPASFFAELTAMHEPDRVTHTALMEGLKERGFSSRVLSGADPAPAPARGFATLSRIAGRLLADPVGPRVAALETPDGWDTHGGQVNMLGAALRNLDAGLTALQEGLGDVWAQTVVLVVTEFGRTVRSNGTLGTDHGTGTACFVLGGPVAGGRVAGHWPGLADRQLFENRDLQPTTDIRSVSKGLLMGHLGLKPADLNLVFPDSGSAQPMNGLLRG